MKCTKCSINILYIGIYCIDAINKYHVFLTVTAAPQFSFGRVNHWKELIKVHLFGHCSQVRMVGERGSGAGKGGGGGGSIRDAGGSFGKMEAAHEDQYFYNLVSNLSIF